MTLDAVNQRLGPLRPVLEYVHARVRDDLRSRFDPYGFAVVSRIKEAASIAEKIESGRFAAWSDLDDLVAATVVVPTLREEPTVLEGLRELFSERDVKSRGSQQKSPDVFRFDSTRFIGVLRASRTVDPSDPVFSFPFEIQVRTAFEHAWLASTHSLAYKAKRVDWRTLRLAAQLKAIVEQMDTLIAAYDSVSSAIEVSNWPEVEAKSLVAAELEGLEARGVVEIVSMPNSLGRAADNLLAFLKAGADVRGGRQVVEVVKKAIQVVEGQASEGNRCPRSLSAVQWMELLLLQSGFVDKIKRGYVVSHGLQDLGLASIAIERVVPFDWQG